MLSHNQHACKMAINEMFFAGGPMIVAYSGIGILFPQQLKNNNNKNHCQKFTPSDKTFWIRT